jgi:hypothetical protein
VRKEKEKMANLYYSKDVRAKVAETIAAAVDEIVFHKDYENLDVCTKMDMIKGVYLMAAGILEHFDDEKKEEEK